MALLKGAALVAIALFVSTSAHGSLIGDNVHAQLNTFNLSFSQGGWTVVAADASDVLPLISPTTTSLSSTRHPVSQTIRPPSASSETATFRQVAT